MKHKLELTEKQLRIVSRALEAYSRAHTGQFDIWYEETFAHGINSNTVKELDFQEKQILNDKMKNMILKSQTGMLDIDSNGSFGVLNQSICGSVREAYNISKVIQEFLSVRDNDGYWGDTRNFDGPLGNDKETPSIEGFSEWVEIEIKSEDDKSEIIKHWLDENAEGVWTVADKYMPKGVETSIRRIWPLYFLNIDDDRDIVYPEGMTMVLQIHKPRKKA